MINKIKKYFPACGLISLITGLLILASALTVCDDHDHHDDGPTHEDCALCLFKLINQFDDLPKVDYFFNIELCEDEQLLLNNMSIPSIYYYQENNPNAPPV
ncbi:MAG: hypothetical protein GY754_10705 [bacterium]|nr:hypothetical protein [bacterium]